MIVAKNFRISHTPTSAVAQCDLIGPGFPKTLGFSVAHEQAHALDIEQPDWAAVALLYPAMLMGEDITIEADLSPLLLHNMRNDLMALLRNFEPSAKPIRIEAGQSSRRLSDQRRDVCTGFSGGVDSFATLARYTDESVHPSLRLTALASFHVGALGPVHGHPELLDQALDTIRPVAREKGMRLYGVTADLDAIFRPAKTFGPTGFTKTVGFRNAASALVLQKGVRTYMPSGAIGYDRASYGPILSTELIDPVLQPLLHTEDLRMIPAVAGLGRFAKTELLSRHDDAQRYLQSCVVRTDQRPKNGVVNCSQCWKCTLTMLALDSLGELDGFHRVFDVAYYRANRKKLLKVLMNMSAHFWRLPLEGLDRAKAAGIPVPRADLRPIFYAKLAMTRANHWLQRRMMNRRAA